MKTNITIQWIDKVQAWRVYSPSLSETKTIQIDYSDQMTFGEFLYINGKTIITSFGQIPQDGIKKNSFLYKLKSDKGGSGGNGLIFNRANSTTRLTDVGELSNVNFTIQTIPRNKRVEFWDNMIPVEETDIAETNKCSQIPPDTQCAICCGTLTEPVYNIDWLNEQYPERDDPVSSGQTRDNVKAKHKNFVILHTNEGVEHHFHTLCIINYHMHENLDRVPQCPLCRSEISHDDWKTLFVAVFYEVRDVYMDVQKISKLRFDFSKVRQDIYSLEREIFSLINEAAISKFASRDDETETIIRQINELEDQISKKRKHQNTVDISIEYADIISDQIGTIYKHISRCIGFDAKTHTFTLVSNEVFRNAKSLKLRGRLPSSKLIQQLQRVNLALDTNLKM